MSTDFSPDDIEHARKFFAGPCDFMRGITTLTQLPEAFLPEVAFAGRSNVGKSSLINTLTHRKTLANVSNTPGRTAQLNFFNLGGRLCLVDMPGYGYAKVSKTERALWADLIYHYLRGRPTLHMVFILIDSRHGLKDSDLELMKMLDETAVPYRIIFTKTDKTSLTALKTLSADTLEILKKHAAAYPAIHETSAEKGTGIPELRAILESYAFKAS